ncbi:MAG: hypothetical protein H6742_07985 [Alphaproteobacteria bacterium]|nr:hypothetical protein [Alphaproteobacteria bacterium]
MSLALLPLLALAACGDKDPSGVLTVEIDLGTVTAADASLASPGVLLVPNLDDEDGDGVADWDQSRVGDGDDDVALVQVTAPAGARIELTSTTGALRVWKDGAVALASAGDDLDLDASDSPVELWIEAGDYRATGLLTLTGAESGDSIALELTTAPLILNHHLQRSEQVMSVKFRQSGYDNTAMIDEYIDHLGDAFLSVGGAKYQDPWIQDEIEFATATSPAGDLDVVMDSIRDGQWGPGYGLDPFAEDQFLGDGWSVGVWGRGLGNGQDYFGNLEISPPTVVDGVEYPYGRIYYGTTGFTEPNQKLREFLDAQQVQKPFVLDVGWLCVGHVDEFLTTVPDASARLGWKLVYSDVDLAWEVIDAMDPSTELTRFASSSSKDWDTAGELQEDEALRALNEELRDDYLGPNLEILKAELGLTDDDIIRIPGLFEVVAGCQGLTAAAFPGMANLIVADDTDGTPTLFVPDPQVRTDVADDTTDPIAQSFVDAMPDELGIAFLDDWEVYHLMLGEVHCGSNVVRTPDDSKSWWQDAAHLLTEAE